MNENNNAPFTIEEIGTSWGKILGAQIAENLLLRKQVEQLQAINEQLKLQLNAIHKAETDIIAREAETIINQTAQKK